MTSPPPVAAPLAVVRACELKHPPPPHERWLIEPLWGHAAVGIVGGAPKSFKSWLGLEMALSVATASPCLGRFPVAHPGPALVYLAEDGEHDVHDRLAALCHHRGLDLTGTPLFVITEPVLRLDTHNDQRRLADAVGHYRPRLLLLDPFVRCHRVHENDAGEVSALLGYLRALQRQHNLAIVVVHHTRKNGPDGADPGRALRGSTDFHAWGDSNLYLRRNRDLVEVTIEHRAAAPPPPLTLALVTDPPDEPPRITVRDGPLPPRAPARSVADLDAAILHSLASAPQPVSRSYLRDLVHVRTETLVDALERLAGDARVMRDGNRWTLPDRCSPNTPL